MGACLRLIHRIRNQLSVISIPTTTKAPTNAARTMINRSIHGTGRSWAPQHTFFPHLSQVVLEEPQWERAHDGGSGRWQLRSPPNQGRKYMQIEQLPILAFAAVVIVLLLGLASMFQFH